MRGDRKWSVSWRKILRPIGDQGSPERAWSDDILHNLIEPIAAEFGYNARRAIDESRPGEITANMIADIIEADLVVADLTFHNANVFYELAVRHAQGTPFIHIAKVGTKIPFDISTINTVFVDCSTFAASAKSQSDLASHFKSIEGKEATFDNPIKRFQQKLQADQTGDPVQKRLVALEEQVANLARPVTDRDGSSSAWSGRAASGRFAGTNLQITRKIESDMRQLLLGHRFKLVYDPISGKTKAITFLENGQIGEGRNVNESSWMIVDGRLEILQADGRVHSRFIFIGNNKSFHHTGENDLQSIRGQTIVLE